MKKLLFIRLLITLIFTSCVVNTGGSRTCLVRFSNETDTDLKPIRMGIAEFFNVGPYETTSYAVALSGDFYIEYFDDNSWMVIISTPYTLESDKKYTITNTLKADEYYITLSED